MYPQMSDYVKKQDNQDNSQNQGSNMPCVLFNMGILDPQGQENNLYDPNFISNYYRMNMQSHDTGGMHEVVDEKKTEGEEIFDPYNLKGEMGNVNEIIKGEQKNVSVGQPTKSELQSSIDYSKYDYNKYIEHMYSNQGKKGKQNQKKGNINNNINKDIRTGYYDKNEVNEDVNRWYEEFYKEEYNSNSDQNNEFSMNNQYRAESDSSFSQINNNPTPMNSNSIKVNHEFARPMAVTKRKSRFDDGPKEQEEALQNQKSNLGPEDIKIENLPENR